MGGRRGSILGGEEAQCGRREEGAVSIRSSIGVLTSSGRRGKSIYWSLQFDSI